MKTKKIKALILEDSEDDLKLMLRELEKDSYEIEYRLVVEAKGLENALEEEWDVIISDYAMPDFTGYDALIMCNKKGIDTPFIILSGTIGEDIAVEMMKAGAKDYIMKNSLKKLLPSIEREITEAKNRKEKKQAEEKLRESEERVRSLYENSTIGLYRTTPDGKVLLANPTLVSMLGYSSFEELRTKDLTKEGFAPLYPRSLFVNRMEKEGVVRGLESSWRRKDGKIIFVRESASVIKDSKGKIIYYDGTVEDFTERKQAEELLAQKRIKYQELTDSISDVFFSMDKDLRYTYWNKASEKLTGVSAEKAIGKTLMEIFPDNKSRQQLKDFYLQVIESKKPQYTTVSYPGNEYNVHEISAYPSIEGVSVFVKDITEQKQEEQKLIETKNYLENLINYANAPIIVWDPEFKITRFNKAFEIISGYNSADMIGDEFYILFPEETKNKSLEEIGKTLGGDKWESVEIPILCSNGDVKIILWNSSNIYDNNGKTLIATIAQGLDITERKKIEELLKQSEENYRSLVENVNVGVYSSNLDGVIIKANKKAYDILGYDSEYDSSKLLLTDIYYDKDERNEVIKILLTEGMIHNKELKVKKKNGNPVWINLSAKTGYDKSGEICRIDGIIDDISEERKLRDELKLSEELFRKVNSSALDAVIIIDDTGKITFWNQSAERIFGFTSDEAIGKKFHSILVQNKHQEVFNKKFPEFIKTGKGNVIGKITEITAVKKDGTIFPVEISLNSIEVKGKRHAIGVVRDITERKQAENALQKSELRFKQVSENAQEWIWEVDKNGLYTYASPVAKEILGFESEEIVNKKYFYDLFIPEGSEQLKLSVFELFKRKESFKNLINENLHKDGRKIILSSSGVPILDNEGNLAGYRGVDVDVTEQKQAEELLRENESSLRYAQEIAKMGSWEWDLITKKTYWSDNYFAILGLKPGEVEPSFEFFRNRIHPDDIHFLDLAQANTNKNKIPASFEIRIILPDGTIKWLQDYVVPVIEDDKLVKLKGVIIDITVRKQSEENIINSKKLLQRIIDLLPIRIFWKDNNLMYLGCNEIFAKDAGKKNTEDLIGLDDFQMGWKEQAKIYREDDESVIKSGIPKLNIEEPQTTPEGDTIWLNTSKVPLTDNQGKVIGILGSYEDITERKKAEEKLRKSEEQFRTLIENQGEGIGITDLNETFIFANPAAHEIFGVPEGSLVGKHLADFISRDSFEKVKMHTEQKRENKKSIYELEINRPDGEKRILHITTTPRFDHKNQLTGAFGIFRDITESKIYETEILLAKEKAEESERIKASFLANMSHELRTPMVGILGYTELLKENLEDTEMREMAESIHISGKRLMETLNLILDLSIIEHGKINVNVKKTDIVSITEDVLVLYQASALKKNLILSINSPFENYIVNLDEKLFYQIISNLVNNGIKYTKSGSVIVEIAKETNSGKEWAVIKVKDTGMGIPEDKLDIIFEEFRQVSEGYSRSFEGTGLGLTITKNFVEIMNGNISVESKLGSGTVFTVKFPTSNKPRPDSVNIKLLDDESKQIILPTGDYKILCVDDDETNNSLVGLILGENYKIDFVLTAEKSIELSSINKYDIILMDINLGYGMTGIDVVREIKKFEMNKNTPVVALTAFTMKGDMQEFLANGCDYYLSKPYTTRGLKELVKNIIKKKK